jgi:putative transposase
MALFGAPIAHEDSARRAVHAALGIQRSLSEYSHRLQAERGLTVAMRIGLNTGPVVVGRIGDDLRMDYTAVEHHQVRERRNQLRHPHYAAPELLARRPNELWSWDITKLLGPAKWNYFYLYVMLDVFSRYVVGWMVAHREGATLAERFIAETCARQSIDPGQLTIHADRGSAMTSKPVALLLADLGVTKTHARPHVSNDNPFSEAQFKTLKYRPMFPERFGSIQDARAHCHGFFTWYNTEHHHSSLGLRTPADVHHGLAEERVAARAAVLARAYAAYPERFPSGAPHPPARPVEVWINPPTTRETEETRRLAAMSLTTCDLGS